MFYGIIIRVERVLISMDFSSLSREQLEKVAEQYFQNWQNAEHNAELYLNQLNRLKNEKYGKKSEKIVNEKNNTRN